ncbi:MAG: ABC transporter permease [Sphaerochaeta sp.]|jgi:simple sugar transport system permease protein|nr:ABC transporter permease [Sphaerochaeta sp.]MCH3919944.1 ABC transporter permease [Sphaerochaeta sp.]MCI2045589.1 ABC transporter permease [Sphaerochaeta sp.]MCI2097602.1 ABC transporter permease [Sphaerochaeta sp.]MCI2104033.1 ABC transporter permease [Sphaerochaeta sp.]
MGEKLEGILFNLAAVVIGLVISASLLLFLGLNPLGVIGKAFAKIVGDGYNLGEILVKATPLVFTSLAFAFTFQANLFNIGAQGQFSMGAIVAVALSLSLGGKIPQPLLLVLVAVASFAAGGAVGALIGLVKAKFNANEFLVSMMSTYVVAALMDYLLRTSLQETKAEYMQSDAILPQAYLPTLIPGTRVTWGIVIAVLTAIAISVLLYKTSLGFRIRAVGFNCDAAELGGIPSGRMYVISFLIAGGLAGMSGLTEINGVQHMLLRNFNASIGSYGIGIAVLANGNPIGCIFASLLFGFLNVMGTTMGRLPGVTIPASIIELIEGVVMTCVIIFAALRYQFQLWSQKRRIRREVV